MNITQENNPAILAKLYNACLDKGWSEKDLEELSASGCTALVLYESKQPASFILYRTTADETEIIAIGTLPKYRSQGFASALFQEIGQHLPKNSSIFLEVAEDNISAQHFYCKHGFEKISQRKNYYKKDKKTIDALVMRKQL